VRYSVKRNTLSFVHGPRGGYYAQYRVCDERGTSGRSKKRRIDLRNAHPAKANPSRAVNIWRIPGKDYSRFETLAKMDLWALRRSVPSQPMDTACTTWPAMCGNGAATGIGSIATSRPQAKTFVVTPGDQLRVMTQAIRTLQSGSSKAVHSFATPTTARVTALVRVAGRHPTPARPIQVSGA
jgi:hypothetical protein